MTKKLTAFQQEYLDRMQKEEAEHLEKNSGLIQRFIKICEEKKIILNQDNFQYIPTIGIIASSPNIVELLDPSLVRDKEGLLDCSLLNQKFTKQPFASGYFYSENYMLMAHPYFRRGFSSVSSFAPRFIELFWKLNQPHIDSYISLDFNRVRINVDNSMLLEFDTWYGSKFNDKIEDIDDGIIKLRPPLDIDDFTISFCFGDTYSLDIKWDTKPGIRTFQAEEFKVENYKIKKAGSEFHPVKYVHAEFDIERNSFRHFDGAIHYYEPDEYFKRRESDFNYNNKNRHKIKTISEKLFKLNGTISTATWIEFTSHFLTGNPLVIEYFEGSLPENVLDIIEATRKNSKDK